MIFDNPTPGRVVQSGVFADFCESMTATQAGLVDSPGMPHACRITFEKNASSSRFPDQSRGGLHTRWYDLAPRQTPSAGALHESCTYECRSPVNGVEPVYREEPIEDLYIADFKKENW